MTRRHVRDLLLGIVLAVGSGLGALYQVNESMAQEGTADGSLPQLVCPLH